MKQGLQLRLSQNLSLTPQLQQAIKLLQMSTLDLNQEIDALIQTNPLLERGEIGEDEYGNASDEPTETIAENSTLHLATAALDEDRPANTDQSDIAAEEIHPVQSPSVSTEIEEIAVNSEFQTEFTDEHDEFSNGSRWDENSQPADDDSDFKLQQTLQLSLHDHLLVQVKLMPFSERDLTLILLLVDSINDDGYLVATFEEITQQLPAEFAVDPLELKTALQHIQNLEPIGIGARNLSECLLLQLNALNKNSPNLTLAKQIVKAHLPALASRDFNKIKKNLGCDDATLKAAQQLITHLNPRPGSQFCVIHNENYIQHEVIVKKIKGIWVANLNDSVIPKLKINRMYAGILKRNRDSANQYLQSQMQEAKWMIKNIQQRFSTILRTAQAIVDRQRNFLEYGEIAMRPLVLREIADELGLHESTISRVTTHKYMLTPRGVFELKYFFGSSVSTEAGGTCSATAIRALIKKLLEEENPKKPFSDNQISALLSKQGIVIARRTIAKYRESLNIAPASLRKTL